MAWNEPGKGKDPWGNNGSGPPDLDEVWQKLRARFGGRGGSGNGSGSSGGGPGFGAAGIGIVVAIIVVIWLLSGFYVVEAGERGVVLQFGAYKESVSPGPHWHLPYPIQSVETVDVQKVRSAKNQAVMLTKDENIVDVKVTVQYRVADAGAYLFNIRAPDQTVQEALKSAVREVVGTSSMNQVIQRGKEEVSLEQKILGKKKPRNLNGKPVGKGPVKQPEVTGDEETVKLIKKVQSDYPSIEKRSRAALPQNITKILQYNLDAYKSGLKITSVNVQYAQPPEQVQSAYEKAIKAREEQQKLENEARAYSRKVINQAQGQADALANQAQGYQAKVVQRAQGDAARFIELLAAYQKAPDVTRKRLYLDTMEEVMQNTSKVLVDSDKGNQLIYLPLDKLLKQRSSKSASASDGSGSSDSNSGQSSSGSNSQSSSSSRVEQLRSRSRQ